MQITGCARLPEMQCVFSGSNNDRVMVSCNNVQLLNILRCLELCLTFVSENTVVVSVRDKHKIQLI